MNIFVSDIALEHYNSTRQLVVDLLNSVSESQKKEELLFIIARNKYSKLQSPRSLRCIEIFIPFYKSKKTTLRIFSECYFFTVVIFLLFWITIKRYSTEKRLAIISPPGLSSFILLWAKFLGFKKRYLIQRDIYNEVWLSSDIKLKKFMNFFLILLIKIGFQSATHIGFENDKDAQQQKLLYKDIKEKSEVLINWCCPLQYKNHKKEVSALPLKMIYAGNIGIAQNPYKILDFLISLKGLSVTIDFYGSGSHYSWLRRKSEERGLNVNFNNAITNFEMEGIMNNYQIGLLFLDPLKVINNFPGKAMLYMKFDLPTLAIANKRSFISELLITNQLGIIIENVRNAKCISSKINEASMLSKRSSGRIAQFATKNLSVNNVYERIFG